MASINFDLPVRFVRLHFHCHPEEHHGEMVPANIISIYGQDDLTYSPAYAYCQIRIHYSHYLFMIVVFTSDVIHIVIIESIVIIENPVIGVAICLSKIGLVIV